MIRESEFQFPMPLPSTNTAKMPQNMIKIRTVGQNPPVSNHIMGYILINIPKIWVEKLGLGTRVVSWWGGGAAKLQCKPKPSRTQP